MTTILVAPVDAQFLHLVARDIDNGGLDFHQRRFDVQLLDQLFVQRHALAGIAHDHRIHALFRLDKRRFAVQRQLLRRIRIVAGLLLARLFRLLRDSGFARLHALAAQLVHSGLGRFFQLAAPAGQHQVAQRACHPRHFDFLPALIERHVVGPGIFELEQLECRRAAAGVDLRCAEDVFHIVDEAARAGNHQHAFVGQRAESMFVVQHVEPVECAYHAADQLRADAKGLGLRFGGGVDVQHRTVVIRQ